MLLLSLFAVAAVAAGEITETFHSHDTAPIQAGQTLRGKPRPMDLSVGGFSSYLEREGVKYSRPQIGMRYRIYKEAVQQIQLHNSAVERTYDMGLNQFTTMTAAERVQYLGLANETLAEEEEVGEVPEPQVLLGAGSSIDHVKGGLVGPVKNQGACGSCWAFASTASIEGVNAAVTWKLKNFADQEVLDCTYSESRDGCGGGSIKDGMKHVEKSGRLALTKNVWYSARDRKCDYAGKVPSNLHSAKVTGYRRYLIAGDKRLQDSIWTSVPSVAIIVLDDFFQYSGGIYNGCPSTKHIDVSHAVTAVGYDPFSWKVKNSWGERWGEGGFVRMSRSRSNICRINDFITFPHVQLTAGHYTIRNVKTGRYLSLNYEDWEDVRDSRGTAGPPSRVLATDANYHNDGLWKVLNLGNSRVTLEHIHTGRYLSAEGDPVTSAGSEGGWLAAPLAVATVELGKGAVWWRPYLGTGKGYKLVSTLTRRWLLAGGSKVGTPSGSYGEEGVVAADDNYSGMAQWEFKSVTSTYKKGLH